jgi:hypothetical protein
LRRSALALFFSRKPAVYTVRYSRGDGHYREITVPTGRGRFKTGSQKEALEIAERRLHEQYGDGVFQRERREQEIRGVPSLVGTDAEFLRLNPNLHQDNYTLDSIRRT